MERLFNTINVGYMRNFAQVRVNFKKKYIYILEKLLKINCISSFTIDKQYIFVNLRYYQNKPIFFFSIRSTRGNKIYTKYSKNIKNKYNYSILPFIFTSYGLLTLEESFFKRVGGEYVVEIYFLNKK